MENERWRIDKGSLTEAVEKIDEDAGHIDRQEEQEIHHAKKQHRAEPWRKCDPVEPVGQKSATCRGRHIYAARQKGCLCKGRVRQILVERHAFHRSGLLDQTVTDFKKVLSRAFFRQPVPFHQPARCGNGVGVFIFGPAVQYLLQRLQGVADLAGQGCLLRRGNVLPILQATCKLVMELIEP